LTRPQASARRAPARRPRTAKRRARDLAAGRTSVGHRSNELSLINRLPGAFQNRLAMLPETLPALMCRAWSTCVTFDGQTLLPIVRASSPNTASSANSSERIEIEDVLENAEYTRENDDGPEVDFRLENGLTRPPGSLRFVASSWSVGSIWGKSGPPSFGELRLGKPSEFLTREECRAVAAKQRRRAVAVCE
jgi:hypothetical protein